MSNLLKDDTDIKHILLELESGISEDDDPNYKPSSGDSSTDECSHMDVDPDDVTSVIREEWTRQIEGKAASDNNDNNLDDNNDDFNREDHDWLNDEDSNDANDYDQDD
ncbi:hypothetical protein FQA39_LY16287 [Lamprigera yunnana]|nr:hypothetical protein FQA39_LY16287 [Lamprigera yunnana]